MNPRFNHYALNPDVVPGEQCFVISSLYMLYIGVSTYIAKRAMQLRPQEEVLSAISLPETLSGPFALETCGF